MKRTGQGLHTPHVSGQSIRDRTLLLSGAKKTHGFHVLLHASFRRQKSRLKVIWHPPPDTFLILFCDTNRRFKGVRLEFRCNRRFYGFFCRDPSVLFYGKDGRV